MRQKLLTIAIIVVYAIDIFLAGMIVGMYIPKASNIAQVASVYTGESDETELTPTLTEEEREVLQDTIEHEVGVIIEEPVESKPQITLTQEEIELIALITMGEAEGEPEEGKRLVIDTILNRVDSEHFPDTVREVIYQRNQFSCVWSDRLTRCYVREDICQLVREELENRTNYDCVFFNANHYSIYGEPMFQVGNHYFSSYE